MVWAAFGYNGVTPIFRISTKMNVVAYIAMLEETLVEYGDCCAGDN